MPPKLSKRQARAMPLEDDLESGIPQVEARLRNLKVARNTGRKVPRIDLTLSDDEETKEEKAIANCEAQIDHELDSDFDADNSLPGPWSNRNRSIPKNLQKQCIQRKGTLITPKTLVEVLQRPKEEYNWQFLYVYVIYTDPTRGTLLRGTRLTRQRYLRGLLPRDLNEICAIYDLDEEDGRKDDIQAAVDIPVTDVIRTREFCRTNDAFPAHRRDYPQWSTNAEIEDQGLLIQRWKYHRNWPTHKAMMAARTRCYSGRVIRLRSMDIEDKLCRVPDEVLRNVFRGAIVRGGSYINGRYVSSSINLTGDGQDFEATLSRGQKYTADDIFCGAGGASCGIRQAGVQVLRAYDNDKAACATFRRNFPKVKLMEKDVFDANDELRALRDYPDFLHISPPCQFFSPAHATAGKNDDANIAALFACGEMLTRRRPRLSTGEQTYGLLDERFSQYFNALVAQFTSLGYSFSWGLLRFNGYGVPSYRKRLIWIASCPGEELPPFPSPTHGESEGLLARVTLGDVLRKVKLPDSLHNSVELLEKAKRSVNFPQARYPLNTIIGTITTGAHGWYHPDGKREFTIRELAQIQTFPPGYRFCGTQTQIKRQIGNAFPPTVVKTLYEHLKRWLLRQDMMVPNPNNRTGPVN